MRIMFDWEILNDHFKFLIRSDIDKEDYYWQIVTDKNNVDKYCAPSPGVFIRDLKTLYELKNMIEAEIELIKKIEEKSIAQSRLIDETEAGQGVPGR